jgi:thioredoxin-like negative regulator of GroEL
VIGFHDDACPPCRAILPVIDELSGVYENRVLFYKVDMSSEADLARDMGIKNLPTVVLCPLNDKPVVFAGAAAKDKLRDAIERELLGAAQQPADEPQE